MLDKFIDEPESQYNYYPYDDCKEEELEFTEEEWDIVAHNWECLIYREPERLISCNRIHASDFLK